MSLTLDPELATAQELQVRHPLVELTSTQLVDDIPFDGNYLGNPTISESDPQVISHSTGRLCVARVYNTAYGTTGGRGIVYTYSDLNRIEFYSVTIQVTALNNYAFNGVSICEMPDGNIGMVYLYYIYQTYYLASRIVTVAGVDVAGSVKAIGNWSNVTYPTSDPWVATLAPNSYLMVYGKKSGADYYIYKRTSSDFLTWSSESALSIAGLTSTWQLDNPSILKVSATEFWLFFDVTEAVSGLATIKNVYYSISTDTGSTWGTAVKFTACTTYGESATHPVATQKAANQMHVIYNKVVGALHHTKDSTGWSPGAGKPKQTSFDPINRKLYTVNCIQSASMPIESVSRIDVDTWTVDKFWNTSTTYPLLPSGIVLHTHEAYHDGPYMVFWGTKASFSRTLYYFDAIADTITTYTLTSMSGFPTTYYYYIKAAQVDRANNKIWILLDERYDNTHHWSVGYIDLTETQDYTFTVVVPDQYLLYGCSDIFFHVSAADDAIAVTNVTVGGGRAAHLTYYSISAGAIVFQTIIYDAQNAQYRWEYPFIKGGYLYVMMFYWAYQTTPLTDKLRIYKLSDWSYEEPVGAHMYDGENQYQVTLFASLGGNKIVYQHYPYGIIIYDHDDRSYTVYTQATVPGLATITSLNVLRSDVGPLSYDAVGGMLFFCSCSSWNPTEVTMFSIYGYIRQSNYKYGVYSGGNWTWGAALQLIQGYSDYDSTAVPDFASVTSMYVFWTRTDLSTSFSRIMWDKDGSSINITPYVTGAVETEYTIDGKNATLSFKLSYGHLFDPYNTQSALSNAVKKGKKILLRWGELIDGVSYWQNAGTFYITETSLYFQRGAYPILNVEAEDRRCLWEHLHVYATEYFSSSPLNVILSALLEDHASVPTIDINIPTTMSAVTVTQQWMETTLIEIINQICDRAGHYFRFDVDGDASARLITDSATVSHVYTDQTKLVKYTPDDRYSTFTNKVTVRGQELTFTTVTYEEERIGEVSGTLGWWGCSADHWFWFSDDQTKICVNPRMNVLESATSIAMTLAGDVEESLIPITTGDYANKVCLIRVDAPSLVAALIVAIVVYLVAAWIPNIVVAAGFIVNAGFTINIGGFIQSLAMIVIVNILGSVANYQIEIYACPQGSIRRSIQGSVNDLVSQYELGAVIEQVVDDPLCYTLTDCLDVANFELKVVQMQRKRVMLEKVAHLQDEDGDTITVVHPYSNQNIDVFIAKLKRKYEKASSSGDGYFLDEIEGWVIE